MIYTAVFQDSDGQLYSEVYSESPNRDVAWQLIHVNRRQKSTCLIALIAGNHYIFRYRDLQRLKDKR